MSARRRRRAFAPRPGPGRPAGQDQHDRRYHHGCSSGGSPLCCEQLGDDRRPSGLVAGAEPLCRCRRGSTRGRGPGRASADRVWNRSLPPYTGAPPVLAQEDRRQPPRQLGRDLPQGHHLPRAGRALHLEVVAEVVVELLERLDQQVVERETRSVRASWSCRRRARSSIPPARSRRRDPGRRARSTYGLLACARATARGCRSGERNSRSSSMRREDAAQLRRRRRSTAAAARPAPGACIDATLSVRSGRLLRGTTPCAAGSRAAARASPARASPPRTAESGPTIERTLQRDALAVARVQHVVEEPVLLVPQAQRRVAAVRSSRARCRGSARRTCWRCPRRSGLRPPAPWRWRAC